MAQIPTKGAVIKQDISSVMTPVAQIVSFGHSGAESENYDGRTVDQVGAGIPYFMTGYAEGGTFDFELFWDSELPGHQSMTDDLTTPAKRDYSITLAGGTEQTFTTAGIGFGFSGEMSDGVKGDVSLKIDQLMSYTT